MRGPRAAAALVALLALAAGCDDRDVPPELDVFEDRVRTYVALHRRIESDLPDLAPTADAAAIDERRRTLAKRLGAAPELQPSGIFTPATVAACGHVYEIVWYQTSVMLTYCEPL